MQLKFQYVTPLFVGIFILKLPSVSCENWSHWLCKKSGSDYKLFKNENEFNALKGSRQWEDKNLYECCHCCDLMSKPLGDGHRCVVSKIAGYRWVMSITGKPKPGSTLFDFSTTATSKCCPMQETESDDNWSNWQCKMSGSEYQLFKNDQDFNAEKGSKKWVDRNLYECCHCCDDMTTPLGGGKRCVMSKYGYKWVMSVVGKVEPGSSSFDFDAHAQASTTCCPN